MTLPLYVLITYSVPGSIRTDYGGFNVLTVDMTGWVNADQAATLLGISRRSVYDYALRLKGFPQPTRLGRAVFWKEEELIEWRANHPTRKTST